MIYDLAIIGGGPAGYVAAERAGAKGLSVILFEKKELGGVCLNEGCMPTKTILYSAKIYDSAVNAVKYGVTVQQPEFDYGKIIDRKSRVVRRLVGGVGVKMRNNNVQVVKDEAVIKGRDGDNINITSGGESYQAVNLLVCTGSEAAMPPIPGIAEAGDIIVTSKELLSSKERPQSLVVIGGGVIGMEFASFFNSLGSDVTVVEMLPEILGGFDNDIAVMLRETYAKKGVKFNLKCKVTKIDGNNVEYTDEDGMAHIVTGDKILVSVGRRPITAGFGLESLSVELDRGGIKVDDRMRTNVPNVFAAGDVTGFSMLAHTASREAEVVVNNLTGVDDVMKYDAVPGVVYTNPEVAAVGMTLDAAQTAGIKCKEVKLPMAFAGRFMAENEAGNGLCKVILEEGTETVIGVHMIGNPCSEIIYGACMAIENKMTVLELQKVIFPHPTVSEIIKEASFL